MSKPLQAVLARPDVWQAAHRGAAKQASHPTGHAALDAALHQGGWPRAALTELVSDGCGIGEMQLLTPVLVDCTRHARRLFVVGAPYLPYAPALHEHGVRLERVLVLTPRTPGDALWSLEQILRSGACGCLLAWLPCWREADYPALRRLQLAARECPGPAFLFRPRGSARALSPAALRIRLEADKNRLALEILKQRGGRAGQRIHLPREPQLLATRCTPELLPACVRGAPPPPATRPGPQLPPAPPEAPARVLLH